jgi:hypothetical protein
MKIVRNNQGRGKTVAGMGVHGPRAVIPLVALGVACQSLLGIEDVNPGSGGKAGSTSAGSGGASATGGKGGTGGTTGGTAGKGTGGATGGATGGDAGTGTGGKGGAMTGGTGGATGGSGGDSGEGGSGNETSSSGKGGGAGKGGSAGTAGTGGMPGDPTVRGTVINQLQHPVPGVPVWIGTETVTTDEDGEFEFEDVPETYDVEMVVTYPRYGGQAVAGWVFDDLTRRDPTLQIYGGVALRSGNFTFTSTNPPANTSTAIIALGSEYGSYSREGAGAVQSSFSWMGPAMITATAHGLVWEETANVPTSYSSYHISGTPFVFTDSSTGPWNLDFAPNTVNTDTISGTVTSPTTSERSNAAYVQFTTGAVIKLADLSGSAAMANYSFLVPTLPSATITVVAREGDSYYGAAAVAHRSNVTSGQTTPPLAIPTPPTISGPASGSTINANTMFTWSGPQAVSVWHAESVSFYESIYVVTTKKSIPMPVFQNAFALRAGDDAFFRIEAHGGIADMDDATGPNGYIDSFGPFADDPDGPRRDAGTYAISQGSTFWTP